MEDDRWTLVQIGRNRIGRNRRAGKRKQSSLNGARCPALSDQLNIGVRALPNNQCRVDAAQKDNIKEREER